MYIVFEKHNKEQMLSWPTKENSITNNNTQKQTVLVFVCSVESYLLKNKLIKTVGSPSESNSAGGRTEARQKNAFSIQ